MEELELLPGIDVHLEQNSYNYPIDTYGLEELVFKIKAHTNLEEKKIKMIIKFFFEELRNQISNNKKFYFYGIGSMYSLKSKRGTVFFKTNLEFSEKLNAK